jgi:hypothetical protein
MGKLWTESELKVLTKYYPVSYACEVAAKLNRSVSSVYGQACKMGLHKSAEWIDNELKVKQGDRLKAKGAAYRFKKGSTPHNKGITMTDEVYQKVAPTMFKKGSEPPNRKYDGHERISKDGYIEIRIRPGKYVAKHRMIWESVNGKIADGMVISFKDRNPLNHDINNLELITRVELMDRNTIHQYPPALKVVIKSLSKLKNLIHAKQN